MLAVLLGALASYSIATSSTVPSVTEASAHIAAHANAPIPFKRRPESLGVRTSAPSVFVVDLASGTVLYQKDPHRVMPIASLTKLVTAMVWLDMHPDMQKTVTYQANDFDNEGEDYFAPGDTITNQQLLQSMLIGSVNASANLMARSTIGKDAFVAAMNAKVKALNLKTPTFVEPSGVNPANQSSAADVAALLSTALGYPEVSQTTSMSKIDVQPLNGKKVVHISSTNLLLKTYLNQKPFEIIAAKTGSLPEAGYCMAQVTSNAEGHRIVAVELGSNNHFSRYQDIKALTTWAFNTYDWK